MKNAITKTLSVTTLLSMLLLAAGCATTGAGGDATLMSDLLTERKISRQIYEAPQLASSHINVSCVDGVVTLAGNVENASDAAIAERIAEDIDGVTQVNNLLNTSS